MTTNNKKQLWILIYLISVFVLGCNSQGVYNKDKKTIFYRKFDIFLLKGLDTLEKIDKDSSVEVKYGNQTPIFIKYYLRERVVTLVLEDSFKNNANKEVMVYSTSNFHGGPPGKHKIYTEHSEEYRDLIYVTRDDTIFCKSYTLPVSENYDYDLYLYLRSNLGSIIEYQGARTNKMDSKYRKQDLYEVWHEQLLSGFHNYKFPLIHLKTLPE